MAETRECKKLVIMKWTMGDIPFSRIRVIYVSRPCALGLAFRSVRNIFALQMALVVLTIITLLKLR